MATEDGVQFEPIAGSGLTGLANLGNSCYLASVVQTLFSIPSFQTRYLEGTENHRRVCKEMPANCYLCQMGKMAYGLLSGNYCQEETNCQTGISPSMFKDMISKDHDEFSTMRQQDAQEFLQHVLSTVEQKERASGRDPSQSLRFKTEERLQCLQCEQVRYRYQDSCGLMIQVPAVVKEVVENKKIYDSCHLGDIISNYFEAEFRAFECPYEKGSSQAVITQRFASYPDYLSLTLSRFVLGDNWVLEKLSNSGLF